MQIKDTTYELGRQLAEKHNTDTLFVNDKEEFFLNENLARNSVGNDVKRLKKLTFETAPIVTADADAAISEEKVPYKGPVEIQEPTGKYDALTIPELQAELTNRGIEYADNATKDNLIMLLDADDLAQANALLQIPAGDKYKEMDLPALRAELDKRGISYAKNLGAAKLIALLDADDAAKAEATKSTGS